MSTRITLDELVELIRACDAIAIDRCTPSYFQDFVATRMAERRPDLSVKVRRLSSDHMDLVCNCIMAAQAVLRYPAA
jgi:hypothetical protein